MIKKIDANEYGVVKYAITSVDELNRLPKKIAPSSQAILIENGLRVFVYGDGQWVEEVVDGDLSENMQSIVVDYERSKIGYDGVKRGSLEERLKDDFQGIYDILNTRDYCEYSGKELKVDNTWMGNQIDTRVEGKTLQNLIQEFKILYGQVTIENNTLVYPGNPNGTNQCVVDVCFLCKSNTTYSIIFEGENIDSNNSLTYGIIDLDSGRPIIRTDIFSNDRRVLTFNSTHSNFIFRIHGNNSATNSNRTIKNIMILEGDHTQTPLSELPYFEGIESVGERDIGKNLLDPSELEYGSIVDGVEANYDGYFTNRKRSGFMKVKPNTDYVFSSNLSEPSANWWFYDINKKYVSKGGFHKNITTPSNCEYMRIHNGHTDGTLLSDFKLQVEEGTVATEYEPFGYKIKGKSCGKNLFDIRKWYGARYGVAEDESPLEITEEGKVIIYAKNSDTYTHTGSSGGSICAEVGRKHLYLVHENTTYTLSMKCEGEDYAVNYIQFYDENYNSLGLERYGTDTGFKITFKTPMRTKFLGIRVGIRNATVGSSLCYSDFQLEENDHATSYEPYQESTYSIHSPIPLRSLPNGVCDVYDFESGAVIQRVGKVVLDGSEDWVEYEPYDDDVTKWFRVDGLMKANGGFLSCISDKFICVMSSTHTLTGVGELLSISPTGTGRLNLRINKDKLSSLDVNGFKLWLQANPTTVYYELEEPIIHYLTPSQLKSFEGTTHVISENTLIPTTTTKILTNTYANVSNVNSTTYSLRRGVNNVAETSAMINETDIEQDDVLDITMCAIDELYSMLEPNLE